MNKLFKKTTSILLSAAMALSLAIAPASAESIPVVKAREFRKEFQGVVYSLETLQTDMIKDFDEHQQAGANGMSQSVADILLPRVIAAIHLLAAVYADDSLDKVTRKESLRTLFKLIGHMYLQIRYHEGYDNSSNPDKGPITVAGRAMLILKDVANDIATTVSKIPMVPVGKRATKNAETVNMQEDRDVRVKTVVAMANELQKYGLVLPLLEDLEKGPRPWAIAEFARGNAPDLSVGEKVNFYEANHYRAQNDLLAIYTGMMIFAASFGGWDWASAIERAFTGSAGNYTILLTVAGNVAATILVYLLKKQGVRRYGADQVAVANENMMNTMLDPNARQKTVEEYRRENRNGLQKIIGLVGDKCSVLLRRPTQSPL